MDVALGLLAVLALILANGWFVLGEFAFVAARRSHLEEQAGRGDRRARRALEILQRLSFMLSGAQLGITVTSLLIGYLSRPVFGRALSPLLEATGLPPETATAVAVAFGLALATGAQMVFGELAPKNFGIAHPEAFARALARGMRLYLTLAGPLIAVFDGAANRLLRVAGIEPAQELEGAVSAHELSRVVHESGMGGILSDAQATLLKRVLHLQNLRAADAMVPRPQVVAVGAEDTCHALRDLAIRTGHSRFPVIGDDLDEVLGVVHAKDVFGVPLGERATTPSRDLATRAIVVPESGPLWGLLTTLRRAHAQLAIVVDEHGGTAGVLTLEDIIEELVGQIRDEHDPEEPATHALAGGAYLVPGSWRPDEVTRDTGITLPGGDYETVSGLIMERLGRVPAPGDVIEVPGMRLRVERMEGMAVDRVRLLPLDAPEEPER